MIGYQLIIYQIISITSFWSCHHIRVRELEFESKIFDLCNGGNLIYASSIILSDPYENVPEYDIRLIVGNVGYLGITMISYPSS
jgi:hypothetical protein